jgi:hypothetical protein
LARRKEAALAPAVDHRPETRPILVLESRETFSDDLGGFGERVPGRGSVRSDVADREDFALRRLIVGLRRIDDLAFPMEVRRGEAGREPDYVCTSGDRIIGVEITAATEEDREQRLSQEAANADVLERALQTGNADDWSEVEALPLDGGFGDGADGPAARGARIAAVASAIDRKVHAAAKGAYEKAPMRWLCLYDNSRYAHRGDSADVLAAALNQRSATGFDRVFLCGMTTVTIADAEGGVRTVDLSTNYDIDFVAWTHDQARKAREEGAQALDLEHVAEEIESLGRSDKRARDSHLANLVMHLLKWHYQPERRGRSWFVTIRNCRRQLDKLLAESPSLDPLRLPSDKQSTLLEDAYDAAFPKAVDETGLPESMFPETCPYTIDQILDPDFLPGTERDEGVRP